MLVKKGKLDICDLLSRTFTLGDPDSASYKVHWWNYLWCVYHVSHFSRLYHISAHCLRVFLLWIDTMSKGRDKGLHCDCVEMQGWGHWMYLVRNYECQVSSFWVSSPEVLSFFFFGCTGPCWTLIFIHPFLPLILKSTWPCILTLVGDITVNIRTSGLHFIKHIHVKWVLPL